MTVHVCIYKPFFKIIFSTTITKENLDPLQAAQFFH